MKRNGNLGWLAVLALVALVIFSTQCSVVVPPFESGIRITAETAVFQDGLQTSSRAQPGIYDSGYLVQSVGVGTGSQERFTGFTGPGGQDDHPDAITNAYWFVGALYVGTCNLISDPNFLVARAGGISQTVCRIEM